MTGRAGRTPEQIERDRARSRGWHARQRELATLALAVADRLAQASGQRPDETSGQEQPRPDAERLAELERRVIELEVRLAAREAELCELRAYRQRDRDRSRRNALSRRQVPRTGAVTGHTGFAEIVTGARAGVATANSARASRGRATGGFSGRVNNSGGGVSRARSAAPAPPEALPDEDGTLLDRLWSAPRVLSVIAERGLDAEWERANFERKLQGQDPENWTVEYLVAWLRRSTVQVPAPAPSTRSSRDHRPHREEFSSVSAAAAVPAHSAYAHDPWAGRRPPIAEADLARGGVL